MTAAEDLGPSLLRGLALPQSDCLELAVEEDLELGDTLDTNHAVADVVSKDPSNSTLSTSDELGSQRKALLQRFLKELDALILAQDPLNSTNPGR